MKKIVYLILAGVVLVSLAVAAVYALNNDSLPIFEPEPTETIAEPESTETVAEPEPTETIAEPEPTETVAEPEPTETIAEPNPNEALLGTFICTGKTFADDSFQNAPEYIPLLTLNSDGTIIWRVYYIGGVVDLGGTYVVEDNKVCIYPELAYPVLGYDVGGFPYMDDYFELDIADENTLVMCRVEENHFKGACYAVKVGDAFVRE